MDWFNIPSNCAGVEAFQLCKTVVPCHDFDKAVAYCEAAKGVRLPTTAEMAWAFLAEPRLSNNRNVGYFTGPDGKLSAVLGGPPGDIQVCLRVVKI